MKEILNALATRPMTVSALANFIGLHKDEVEEMLFGLLVNELVEEDSGKYTITDAGRRSINLAEATPALPETGSLMELGDDLDEVTPEPETLLQFLTEPVSATKVAELSALDVRTVRVMLAELKRRRLAQSNSNGRWQMIRKAPKAAQETKPASLETEETFELEPAALERANEIEAALGKIELALTKQPVKDLNTKLWVLKRLSSMFDPTVANVLIEIQNDLKVAA